MARRRGFDEVMIVNPSEPGFGTRGADAMRFEYAQAPEYGYYSEPTEYGYYAQTPEYGYHAAAPGYGYYAEPPDYGYAETPEYGYYGEAPEYGYYAEGPEYGYYAESPEYGYYAQAPEYGYYAQAPEYAYYAQAPEYGDYAEAPEYGGSYAEAPEYGYYAQSPEFGAWGETEPGYAQPEPVGYVAEEYPMAGYGQDSPMGWGETPGPQAAAPGSWGQVPEMVGYGPMGEDPAVAYYGEPEFSGYVRDVVSQPFNAGCPMPTNVGEFEEGPLEGYVTPRDVSPRCNAFTPQPGPMPAVPETFRPLW